MYYVLYYVVKVPIDIMLIHYAIALVIIALMLYNVFRVKVSSLIFILTVALIYTSVGIVGDYSRVYLYLVNVVLLLISYPYSKASRLPVAHRVTKVTNIALGVAQDYLSIVLIVVISILIFMGIVRGIIDYLEFGLPQPYSYILSPLTSTRIGLLTVYIVVFIATYWIFKELLDIPTIYYALSKSDAYRILSSELNRERESVSREPKSVVYGISLISSIFIAYMLWYTVYPVVASSLKPLLSVSPTAQAIFAGVTTLLLTILVNRYLRGKIVKSITAPIKPPRISTTIRLVLILIAYLAFLTLVVKVPIQDVLISAIYGGRIESIELTKAITRFNMEMSMALNERIKYLEYFIRLFMRLLWR
mgnify:CR=1 FL=1